MFPGISQSALNMFALGVVGVFILGVVFFLFWKYVAIGALALFTVVVLANQPVENKVTTQSVEVTKKHNELVPPPKEEFMTDESEDKPLFIEDCLSLTDYSQQKCESIWENREQHSDEVKLLDVENVEYKKRRAEALKKPGAIVAHFTMQDLK